MAAASVSKSLEIKNKLGLHARAAALWVQTVAQFEADIQVTKGDQTVDGKSILGLMMLAAGQGCSIEVAVSGAHATEALRAIEELVEHRFNEEE